MTAFMVFALSATYALWTIHWRCRPGNLWTDGDGVTWTRRAHVLVALAVLLVVVGGLNWVLSRQQ